MHWLVVYMQIHKKVLTPRFISGSALFGVGVLLLIVVIWQRRNQLGDNNYEQIVE